MSITAEGEETAGWLGSLSGPYAAAGMPNSGTGVCCKRHASAVPRATSASGGGSTEPHQAHAPART